MDVSNLSGKWGLVTGAGSGIGRATALALAGRGADLVICDIDQEGLGQTTALVEQRGRKAIAHWVDVADADAMAGFAEAVHAEIPGVDVLVNNAGVGVAARFVDTTLDDWRWIVGINLLGVVHGCHFFVPRMLERRSGHVVNISSMAGFTPFPGMSAYNATKFGVRGLSESMRAELAPHGVGVTVVCPGAINTPIVHRMRLRGPLGAEARDQALAAFARRNYTPERLAEGILAAVQRNKAVAPIAVESRVAWWLTRFAPGLVHWLIRKGEERALRQEAARAGGEAR